MINTNNVQYSNRFSALKNNNTGVNFSASYAGGSIPDASYVGPIRATVAMDNANDISHIQVKLTGLESFYRLLDGTFQADYPDSGTRVYSVSAFSYFKAGVLYVDVYIVNQDIIPITMPAITVDCNAALFLAPF